MLFNDWINKWALLELKIANICFTWSNNQDNLIMASLDRVLATTIWETRFPLTVIKALPKPVSDHTPLLIDTMSAARPISRMFRFEKWWLNYPDFSEVIRKAWSSSVRGRDSLDIWQAKTRLVRKKSKGWSINVDAANKKLKNDLLQEYDILDVFSETDQLNDLEKERMNQLKHELDFLLCQEETKAWQRSRDRFITEGDRNTLYFHALANQRRRKKKIARRCNTRGFQ
jgi:hypothetical protein